MGLDRSTTPLVLALVMVCLVVMAPRPSRPHAATASSRQLLNHGAEIPPSSTNSSGGSAIMRGVVLALPRKPLTLAQVAELGTANSQVMKAFTEASDPLATGNAQADALSASLLPLAILAAVSLLMTLCTPVAAVVFYVARCFGGCGGKDGEPTYTKKQVLIPLAVFLVCFFVTISASIEGMLGSTDMNLGLHVLLDNSKGLITDVLDFTQTVVNNLKAIPGEILPRRNAEILNLLQTRLETLPANVTEAVQPEVNALQNQLALLDGIIQLEYVLVDAMENGTKEVDVRVKGVDVQLAKLNVSIAGVSTRNVSGTVYPIPGLPDVSTFASKLPNVSESTPDFNSIRDKLNGLPDPKNTSRSINTTFADFRKDIEATVANATKDTNTTLEDFRGTLQKSIDGSTKLVDVIREPAADGIKQIEEIEGDVFQYDSFRNAGMQVLFGLLIILYILGIIAVLTNSSGSFSTIACCFWMFLSLLFLLSFVFAFPSAILGDICLDINNAFSAAEGAAGAGPIGIVQGCVRGENFADLLELDKQFNGSDYSDVKDGFDVSSGFNFSASFDAKSDEISSQNVSSSDFNGFNFTSTLEFNLTQTRLDLEQARQNVTLLTFDFRLSDIDVAFADLNNETVRCCGVAYSASNYSATFNLSSFSAGNQSVIRPKAQQVDFVLAKNASAHATVAEVRASITAIEMDVIGIKVNHTEPLESLLGVLKYNQSLATNASGWLNDNATLMNNLTAALDSKISTVSNNSKSYVANSVVGPVFAVVDLMIAEATDFSNLGDCSFAGKRYNGLVDGMCAYMSAAMYAQWFGFAVCGVAMVAGLVAALKNAKRLPALTKLREKAKVTPSMETSAGNPSVLEKMDDLKIDAMLRDGESEDEDGGDGEEDGEAADVTDEAKSDDEDDASDEEWAPIRTAASSTGM